MNLDVERMPMETAAFMFGRKIRQTVRGFDAEGLENFHLSYGCVRLPYSNEFIAPDQNKSKLRGYAANLPLLFDTASN